MLIASPANAVELSNQPDNAPHFGRARGGPGMHVAGDAYTEIGDWKCGCVVVSMAYDT